MPDRRGTLVAVALAGLFALAACRVRARLPWGLEQADPATRRDPPAGPVVGGAGRYGSQAWLGIPYARPPVGPLRWRAPQPLPRWDEPRAALRFGPGCVQYGSRLGGLPGVSPNKVGGDEDCLTLNVWTPPFTPGTVPTGSDRLPVMVWIHGGGNSIGHAAFYDGGNLAVSQRVVVVTLQYRLGPFGWFRHPALATGASTEERSGNFGTLDLVRALRWVRDNIAAFGGNPRNITILGESAGGQNVFTLLLSPSARDLFQRAIVESGGTWHSTPAEASNDADTSLPGHSQSANEILLRLLQRDGAPDRAAAKARRDALPDAAVADYLRARTATDVLTAYTPLASGMIDMPLVIADGNVLPADDWKKRFAKRNGWNRVPVMLGTNKDEDKLFMFADRQWVRWWFGFVPRLIDAPMYDVVAEYLARIWKATGADEPAAAMRTHEARVFVYRFDWDEEPTRLGTDLGEMLGAAHAFEIPFVFGHWDLGREGNVLFTSANEPGRTALSRAMMEYWGEFARTGTPAHGTSGDLPSWTAWDPSPAAGPTFLVLDTPAGGGLRMDHHPESVTAVLAAVDHDPRLPDQRARCRVYHALAARGRGLTRQEYVRAGRQGCAEFPFGTWHDDG